MSMKYLEALLEATLVPLRTPFNLRTTLSIVPVAFPAVPARTFVYQNQSNSPEYVQIMIQNDANGSVRSDFFPTLDGYILGRQTNLQFTTTVSPVILKPGEKIFIGITQTVAPGPLVVNVFVSAIPLPDELLRLP